MSNEMSYYFKLNVEIYWSFGVVIFALAIKYIKLDEEKAQNQD